MVREYSSRSSHACAGSRAGFMLLEVLVSLVIAALFLSLLARLLAGAWQGNRLPMERVTALNIARSIAENMTVQGGSASNGQIGRFAYATQAAPLVLQPRWSDLAPAPNGLPATERPRNESGSASLQRITVTIRSPSGRELSFETVKLDAPK